VLSEALLGSALGGVLRMAPEVLRYMDVKNERAHELAMQKIAADSPVQGGAAELVTAQDIEALKAVYVEKASARASKRYPWVDVWTALVRPVVTVWLVALYSTYKLVELHLGRGQWTADDMTVVSGVLSFWFLSRVWDRK
jgi:hypothetical protein